MEVASPDRVEAYTTKDGSTIRELHRTALQSLAEATVEPGQVTERHHHRTSEEIYFVTKGAGSLEIEGETRRVAKGDAALIPAGSWHTIENNGTSELVFLCICSPPYSHDDTVLEE